MLLRLTLDVSLTADAMVSSELQWTINAVLDPENFHETSGEDSVGVHSCICFTTFEANDTSCDESAPLSTPQYTMFASRVKLCIISCPRLLGLH